jgi:biotin-dependent carboxylase-like uncharacterized protein
MDEYAYLWSQKLLQQSSINALEVMVGLKLKTLAPTIVAITGANLEFQINGISKTIWRTYFIQKGDVLSFNKSISGQRAYLAVKGGFKSRKIFDSYATTLKEGSQAKLNRGDYLNFQSHQQPRAIYHVQQAYRPNYQKTLTLRLLLSYQEAYFNSKEKEKIFSTAYKITMQSNRMGFKLQGQAIKATQGGIISEGIAFGSVQIPKDGQPIVLLKERQTIGGYPKIGTILAIDCFKLAQLKLDNTVQFKVIHINEAQKIMKKFYKNFM